MRNQVKEEVKYSFAALLPQLTWTQIFGPVLSVGKFKTEDEAITLANDTNYGLGAGVYSSKCMAHSDFSVIIHKAP